MCEKSEKKDSRTREMCFTDFYYIVLHTEILNSAFQSLFVNVQCFVLTDKCTPQLEFHTFDFIAQKV